MKPRSGEKPPLLSNSRSQSWRAVRSQDGHSREFRLSSLAASGWTIRLTSSPPCGAIRWLVGAVKSLNLPGSLKFVWYVLPGHSRRNEDDGPRWQELKGRRNSSTV